MHKNVWLLGLAAIACAHLAAPPVYAETATPTAETGSDLEEVVVTAERRSINLQKAGLSVTAISGEAIAQHGDIDVAQVLQNVPGIVLQGVSDGPSQQSVQGGGGPPNIAIRGLGTPSPNTVAAVAVYEDGLLLQGGGANFYDMSRVEVLRGPQGTLYGRGATAGAVNLITNDPTHQFEASGRIQFGSYELIATQGMFNAPLSDVLSMRVAFNQIRRNGFFNNGQSDEDDISARVKLLFSPTDNFSLLLGYVDYNSKGTGPGQVDVSTNPNPTQWRTTVPGGGSDPISYRKAYANVLWGLGFANLSYVGGYQTTDSTFSTYCHCFFGFTYQVVRQPYNKTWTHELRLESTGDSALSWVGGAYYYNNKFQTTFEPGTAAPVAGMPYVPAFGFAQSFSPTSLGLFGEVTYALTTSKRLTGGVRETRDHEVQSQTFEPGGTGGIPATFDATFRHFDWKVRVETDLSANNMLYGTVSTGYRPGGFVNGIKSENETVRAYEIGSKNRIDNMLTLNGAVFYYNYSGFQNLASVPDPNNPGSVISVLVPIPATFYGGELEAVAQLSAADRLTLSPALLEAKFTADRATYLTKDGTIPNTPKWSLSGSYEHSFMLPGNARITWGVDAHYQTQELTDFAASNYPTPSPVFQQRAYAITNTSLTYAPGNGKFNVTVYGRNIFNTIDKLTIYNQGPPPAAFVNDPRTYGVMLSGKL
jgi:iron complex outermembrane receptor protein